jgi:hypothetical protein
MASKNYKFVMILYLPNHGDARVKVGKRKLGRAWNSAFDKEALDTWRKRVQL